MLVIQPLGEGGKGGSGGRYGNVLESRTTETLGFFEPASPSFRCRLDGHYGPGRKSNAPDSPRRRTYLPGCSPRGTIDHRILSPTGGHRADGKSGCPAWRYGTHGNFR